MTRRLQAILVTSSRQLAASVSVRSRSRRKLLSRRSILDKFARVQPLHSWCRMSLLRSMLRTSMPPEHLILEVREPRQWLSRVQNAGSVFLGAWSPEPMGTTVR